MGRGSADEAVVVVNMGADEGAVTYPSQLRKIEAHIRRRLRSRLVDQQKRKRYLYKKLVKRKVLCTTAWKAVFSNRGRWALSHTRAVEMAYPNRWFIEEMGLKIRSDEHHHRWFDLNQWIKVT
jgi:RNA-directed DNA polymerase